jgi:hypothetical protein
MGLRQKLTLEKGIGKMTMATKMVRKASYITGIRNLGDSKPGNSQSGKTRSEIPILGKPKAAKHDHKTDAGNDDDNQDGDTSRDSEVAQEGIQPTQIKTHSKVNLFPQELLRMSCPANKNSSRGQRSLA